MPVPIEDWTTRVFIQWPSKYRMWRENADVNIPVSCAESSIAKTELLSADNKTFL